VRILIAEDDRVSRRLLEVWLVRWGYEVVSTQDGAQAWEVLQQPDAPQLAVLDWMMPTLSGPEVCQLVRNHPTSQACHIVLLTARHAREDIIAGLESGANDYITKPFDFEELRARLKVGQRIVELQNSLAERVRELGAALAQVRQLQGLLPICLYCKRIRDDSNYWQQVEQYIMDRSEARFSHGICPDCYEKVVKPEISKVQARSA